MCKISEVNSMECQKTVKMPIQYNGFFYINNEIKIQNTKLNTQNVNYVKISTEKKEKDIY